MHMDSAALGTWAAVVVALGIALKDTWIRWRDRSARHLLTGAEIFPIIYQLEEALDEVLGQGKLLSHCNDPRQLREASDQIEAVMADLSLDNLRGHVSQVDCLPERMLIPLAKAVTLMQILNHNAGLRRIERSQDDTLMLSDERQLLDEWLEQGYAIKNSIGWVSRGAKGMLASSRWTRPEGH